MSLKLKLLAVVLAAHIAAAQEVRIGVLGLFHPHQLILKTVPVQALVIEARDQGRQKTYVLERSSGVDAAQITLLGDQLILQVGDQVVRTSDIRVVSRDTGAAEFILAVPGKISRHYRGVLDVKAGSGVLVPVIAMELETAVASAVQAESDPDTPLEALKAQAVATRSYFVAGRRQHHDFDFCDTTHCQFLREPPPPDSDFARATLATRSLVLAYRDQAVAAMFARSCGGRTRTPQEVGLSNNNDSYPYFPVACDYCLHNPWRWSRRVSPSEAADLEKGGESFRLAVDRQRGWDAVPSNNFTLRKDGDDVILEGAGQGHGIGLCQRGSKAMAQAGANFRQILDHYYPNTTLIPAVSAADRSGPSTRWANSRAALP